MCGTRADQKRGRTLKIFWEDWYAREISRFVCNEVQLFEAGRLWELYN